MNEQTSAPLHGYNVLEIGTMISAPYCARLLADLGADVIKIESPLGDPLREAPPRYDGRSATFRLLNRNKRSVVLDLKQPRDAEIFRELVRDADVLIQNLRPGALERLGFSDSVLREIKANLVQVNISGFGRIGPWGDRSAYDIIAQAMSGIMAVTGSAEHGPTRVGVSIGDVLPAVLAAFAVVSALLRRERDNSGAVIDLAMVDALVAGLESIGMRALHDPSPIVPTGTDHAISAPYGAFKAIDGQVVIAVVTNALFAKLASALGRPGWIKDPRFADDETRGRNRAALREEMESALAEMTVEKAIAIMTAAGVPCAPVLHPRDVLTSEHARVRGLTRVEEDQFETIGMGFSIDGFDPPMARAPLHGEDNAGPSFRTRERNAK